MLAVPGVATADVVPPEAVSAAESWLALVDRGRVVEAVGRIPVPPHGEAARALTARLVASRRRIATRTIRSWTGHGPGDTLRMEPGSYFSLVLDTVDASGRAGTDEVRLVPTGDGGWRVVDFHRW